MDWSVTCAVAARGFEFRPAAREELGEISSIPSAARHECEAAIQPEKLSVHVPLPMERFS
jgi:hypothetical protein